MKKYKIKTVWHRAKSRRYKKKAWPQRHTVNLTPIQKRKMQRALKQVYKETDSLPGPFTREVTIDMEKKDIYAKIEGVTDDKGKTPVIIIKKNFGSDMQLTLGGRKAHPKPRPEWIAINREGKRIDFPEIGHDVLIMEEPKQLINIMEKAPSKFQDAKIIRVKK